MRLIFGLILALFMTSGVQAQSTYQQRLDSIWQVQHDSRVKKETLNGIYIPKNIGDAHRMLNRLISPEAKQRFKLMSEDQVVHQLFFSLGRWMRVKWSLYEGSRLSESLRELGIYHPEDMSSFIIITYHRKLLKQPFDAKNLIESLAEKRQAKRKK